MTSIQPFKSERFGIDLPDALILVDEVLTRSDKNLYDHQDPQVHKNTLVRCKVYANEEAYLAGLQPLDAFEKVISLPDASQDAVFNAAIALMYPVA